MPGLPSAARKAAGCSSRSGACGVVAPVAAALDAWATAEPDHWAVADAARLAAVRADRAARAAAWFEAHAERVGRDPLAPRRRERGRGGDGRGARRRAGRHADRYRHRHRADARTVRRHARRSRSGSIAAPRCCGWRAPSCTSAGSPMPNCARPICTRCRWRDGAADVAILHQVLHFAQQPGAAIAEAARVLGAGRAAADRRFRRARPRGTARRATRMPGSASRTSRSRLVRRGRACAGADRDARGRRTDGEIMARAQDRRELARGEGGMTTFRSTSSRRRAARSTRRCSPIWRAISRVSFEFFPPKTEKMEETLWEAIADAGAARPALRLGDLWRRRLDARAHARDGRADRSARRASRPPRT